MMLFIVTPLVHFLIVVDNTSAIYGAISKCTHGVAHITSPVKIHQNINSHEKGCIVLFDTTQIMIYLSIVGTWILLPFSGAL